MYPSVSLEYTHDSNIFFTSADLPGSGITASGIEVVRPRILMDLPFRDNRIRWVYAPFYRDYTSQRFKGSNTLNHAFDMEGTLRRGSAVTIGLSDHFVRGTVSIQEQTERNGLTFGLGHYANHNPLLEIDVKLGGRQGFSVIPSYSRSNFTGISDSVQYAYTARTIEGRYNYKLSEPTTLYGYYTLGGSTQTQTGIEDIRIRSRSFGFGLKRTISEAVVTQLTAGYETMDFTGGTGRNFSGPIIDTGATWMLNESTRLEFGFLRRPYASVYIDNNYYVDTEGRARVTLQIGRSTYLDVSAADQNNVYVPRLGEKRRDRLSRMEIGMGHQFLRTLRGYIGASFENRRSNVDQIIGGESVDPFHIRVDRILFRLEMGWL